MTAGRQVVGDTFLGKKNKGKEKAVGRHHLWRCYGQSVHCYYVNLKLLLLGELLPSPPSSFVAKVSNFVNALLCSQQNHMVLVCTHTI